MTVACCVWQVCHEDACIFSASVRAVAHIYMAVRGTALGHTGAHYIAIAAWLLIVRWGVVPVGLEERFSLHF